jgi:hypothetical protein
MSENCPPRELAGWAVPFEKRGYASRQAQTLERGASGSAAYIRHDDQFEYGDV